MSKNNILLFFSYNLSTNKFSRKSLRKLNQNLKGFQLPIPPFQQCLKTLFFRIIISRKIMKKIFRVAMLLEPSFPVVHVPNSS